MFCCEFCQISKNTFSYRTPLVAASKAFAKIVNYSLGLFAKIVNSSKGIFKMESNIKDGAFCVNSEWLKNFFPKISILDVQLCSEYTYGIVLQKCYIVDV